MFKTCSRAFGVHLRRLGSVWDGPASKATGHAIGPARAWLVRSVQACAQGNCAVTPAFVPVRTFSKWAILHRFSNFYELRVEIFRMFFRLSLRGWSGLIRVTQGHRQCTGWNLCNCHYILTARRYASAVYGGPVSVCTCVFSVTPTRYGITQTMPHVAW